MRGMALVCSTLLLLALAGCQPAPPGAAPGPTPPGAATAAAPTAATPASAAPSAAQATPTRGAAPQAATLPPPLNPPVTVRVGALSSISDSGIYIGVERGYYRDLGLDVQVETIPDPNAISTAVAANQLDVGGFGVNANPFQVTARGIGMKMVADKGSLRPGFGFAGLLARQDLYDSGQLRTPADVRGRTVTKLSPCDSSDPWFERLFARGGFTRDDVEFVLMPFPDVTAALANRAVEVGWQLEPLITLATDRGIATEFVTGDQIYPNQQIAAIFYSPDFAAHTDAAQRFMVGYVRALRDYNDAFGPKHQGRAEIAQILAQYTTVKDVALYDRITPAGLDPDGRINVQGVRDDLALFQRLGCVAGELADVSRVVDQSFVDYAVGVLGPYAR
ncbi:MAG TPA: ABC transporter substrate-binding protein [Chloroflexota bacterium]|nr:ABC transporter substrate-binding protein [Chloroflexota bacterium]